MSTTCATQENLNKPFQAANKIGSEYITSILQNIIKTVRSGHSIVAICNTTDHEFLLPFTPTNIHQRLAGSTCKTISTVLKDCTSNDALDMLIVAVPKEIAKTGSFCSFVPEPDEQTVNNAAIAFSAEKREMTNNDILDFMKEKRLNIITSNFYQYKNPIPALRIKRLGGLNFFKQHAEEIAEIAESMLAGKTKFDSKVGQKMVACFC